MLSIAGAIVGLIGAAFSIVDGGSSGGSSGSSSGGAGGKGGSFSRSQAALAAVEQPAL